MQKIKAIAVAIATVTLLFACNDNSRSPRSGADSAAPPTAALRCPQARLVASAHDLVPGPLARGRNGDIVMENRRLRAIVQKAGRNWFSIGQFGGNIIDAVPKRADGSLAAEDHYEEAALGTNIESSPNYQRVDIVSAGGEDARGQCLPAIVRAEGPDDLLDFVNASSIIRDMGFNFPASADDRDLPIRIVTDYILEPGQSHITMRSRLVNESDEAVSLYLIEYINGSGEVEQFQYGYGFGEPLITAPCASCRALIYSGHEGGSGVSYGIIHDVPNTSSLTASGVAVLVYGTDATQLAADFSLALTDQAPRSDRGSTLAPPPFTVPASGELTFTRYFAVGDGSVASILDIQHQILGTATGELGGAVYDDNGPVAGAEIAVIASNRDFLPLPVSVPSSLPLRGPQTIVANHFRTDALGQFRGRLPPGDYQLRVNVPGRAAAQPASAAVSIREGGVTVQDFQVPLPAGLRVRVVDTEGRPIAAKLQLIGEDSSPDAGEPQNQESVLGGLLTVNTGIFGDAAADRLPPGVVLSEFAVLDRELQGPVQLGDSGELAVEPGEYELSVSHGPRYSEYRQPVQLKAGERTLVTATLAQVVDTSGYLHADFHVHSFNSPDAEVTNRERVATYLAEDMDFFTPSDHGRRVDFEPVIADMGVAGQIASAPGSEMTTFDYGHFNAWPVAIDRGAAAEDEASQSVDPKLSQGSVDWGGAAPVGKDFPSHGHYSLSPAEIISASKAGPYRPGGAVVAQINHIDSHFGPAGLAIDTGVSPPRSQVSPASKRLNPALDNAFSANYDSLELWIGVDGREHQFERFLGENLGDWFNLLNQGLGKTFVANSDTHDRRQTSLSTRNQIARPPGLADAHALRSRPHDIAEQLIAGRSIGSNALFMELELRNLSGQLLGGLGSVDLAGVRSQPVPLLLPQPLTLSLRVAAPQWAQYDQVLVFINAVTDHHRDALGQPQQPARYAVCQPDIALTIDPQNNRVLANSADGVDYYRRENHFDIALPAMTEDYWVVVMVRGRDGVSAPLWPVVPNDFSDADGLRTRSAADRGTLAMAMSNPLYVDVGANGWQAPGLQLPGACVNGVLGP